MNDIASGAYPSKYHTDQPMGDHAADYLRGYIDWWGDADAHLCGGQVIVC
ncbi:hypothetical protein AB0F73_04335 [Micromonospora purpureochromogenes]